MVYEIRTLAVKNGYGSVTLYGCMIGGIQNLFQKGRWKVVVVDMDLSSEFFMNLVFGRLIVVTM